MNPLAVSYLFASALRTDHVRKALKSDAGEVIVDLEDAVPVSRKSEARSNLVSEVYVRTICVRINSRDTGCQQEDIEALANLEAVTTVLIPKVESIDDIEAVLSALPSRIVAVALIETAKGIVNAEGIARFGVKRLMFGCADYLTDIGAASSPEVLQYPRSRLVLASRAAGLPPPVDGPSLSIGNDSDVHSDSLISRSMGMGAKLCIHPAQVPIVNAVFRPTRDELRWAQAVLEESKCHGGAAFAFEGFMVDTPVLTRAQQLVESEVEG